ncbi:transient receptor potential cation channel subfamily M member 1-like isoform X4 [Mytilus californianus]|uniref:transient receptor potential cation channel subfamily M member 1-like isoform X3 n=1 Tax=Mytilus californianus TaxID=6549 RepID=UPI002245EC28|nr:transient receptor potential cation channel subfamily M member 1-like isoform X3 [Mytilus californianus]XP_052077426.1 transient receptor potential cation channel subfamily M member 1-like isoform X4 [Mytilus californianus]
MERHKNRKSTVFSFQFQPIATQIFNNDEQKQKNRSADRYLYLPRKSKLRKVLYTQVPDTNDLGRVLENDWLVSPPEAIIAITGISHQFNIKDKRNLKKDLIEAVISTGSWIVTCGTESGVVQFIEDAVNDHVASTTYNIPIVGLLSKRVLDEIKPLKRVLKVKTNDNGGRIRIRTNSTKETLDPNHTQFIVLGDQGRKLQGGCALSECRNAFESFLSNIKYADFDTKKDKEPNITKYDTQSKHAQCETLAVVLVLVEGGIEAMKTVSSVLANNKHVVVINGSGGAANFLSTCYRRDTSFKREGNPEPATLSDYNEDIEELIDECFENDSKELEEEAQKLAKHCPQKLKLIHIYSLENKTTKVAEFIQNAIFNTYQEYYKTKVKHEDPNTKKALKINAVKKQLKLVEKWKRCDIAEKNIFIAKNRNELKWLQTLNEDRMNILQNKTEDVIIAIQKDYKDMAKDLSESYKQLKNGILQLKADYSSVLSTAFDKLAEHAGIMPVAFLKDPEDDKYEVLNEIETALADTLNEKKVNELQTKIEEITGKFIQMYNDMIKNLADSFDEFKKSVLHFEWVQKARCFSVLSKSFYKLVEHMPVVNKELTDEFYEISKEFVNKQTFNEKRMNELKKKMSKQRRQCISEDFILYYEQFKEDLLQFMKKQKENYYVDENRANYFMVINKAKYFTDVSTSFTALISSMEIKPSEKQGKDLNKISKEFVDEYEKDNVSELFKSSLLANRTDFVMLIMEKIESMSSFILDNLPNVFRLCIESKEELAIQLIEKHWNKQRVKEDTSDSPDEIHDELTKELRRNKRKTNNRVLLSVNSFIIDLFEDPEFKLYDVKHITGNNGNTGDSGEKGNKGDNGGQDHEEIDLIYKDKPFHHLFVWAVLVNWREMAMIFWELETDHTCSALFASAVLNELADKALFSKHMHLSVSLKENARHFETLACNVMTELYSTDRESALKTLVTKVGRYNSTPLKIAVSQKLNKFMAHTACQAQLNSIWSGDVAVYTPLWRIGMVTFFPILLIQSIGFITMKRKYLTSKQISPCLDQLADQNPKDNSDNKTGFFLRIFNILYNVYRFYCAPVTKFFVYMIAYMTFVVIFAIFVLTDLYPLSESPPSLLEYASWGWTLSLAIEEIRQILQTNKGSLLKNLKYWAKDVWNIFDIVMYLMFLLSVVLRCLLSSDQFYFARMAYAVTLSMFILRSMHFFFIERFIGPKVVMIGRMFGDLGFFIALYALFVFSFGIMYQAVLFPNSVSSPWELLKDLVYLPYWQLYGELNIDRIEGKEPSECTKNPQLYTNGTMARCAVTNQYNALMLAVYLVLTNILLVNILIAMFSQTFQTVQDNSEIIWKFHRYALVSEYYERPMFPIPIVIHLWRIVVFCYDKLRTTKKYGGAFVYDVKPEEIERLHIVEKIAYETFQNGPSFARNRYDARNMMTDERDINKEIDSTPTQHDIKELREEMHRMRESLTHDIRHLDYRRSVVANNSRR